MINKDAAIAPVATVAGMPAFRQLCMFFPPKLAEACSVADRQAT